MYNSCEKRIKAITTFTAGNVFVVNRFTAIASDGHNYKESQIPTPLYYRLMVTYGER